MIWDDIVNEDTNKCSDSRFVSVMLTTDIHLLFWNDNEEDFDPRVRKYFRFTSPSSEFTFTKIRPALVKSGIYPKIYFQQGDKYNNIEEDTYKAIFVICKIDNKYEIYQVLTGKDFFTREYNKNNYLR